MSTEFLSEYVIRITYSAEGRKNGTECKKDLFRKIFRMFEKSKTERSEGEYAKIQIFCKIMASDPKTA